MAGVPARPNTFFRVSPVESQCFAVRRGDLQVRTDAKYHALRENLIANFPLATLGELVSIKPSYGSSTRAVPRTSLSQPRYIRITDYGDDGIEPGHEFVTTESAENKCALRGGDILFARSGSVGKTYLHEDDSEPAVFAGYCIRFRFDESRVAPRFVYWWTKTEAYERWVATIRRPSVQANINMGEFQGCQIPLPGVDIQNELVAAMDVARAERKAKLAEADALLAGVDDFVLDSLGLTAPREDTRRVFAINPANLSGQVRLNSEYYHPERIAALHSLERAADSTEVARLSGVVSFVREQLPTPTEPYLSLAHVQSHTGELTDSTDTATGNCFVFEPGDVLFARLRPYLNKVHRAETGGTCSTEFHVLRIDDSSALRPDYLAAILRSKVVLAQTVHMMTGNTHPRLTNEDVANLRIPIPSMAVQERIAAEVNRRRQDARRLRAEAESGWQAARQWFEGELLGG